MDTISNVATQAAKVVWGDGEEHREPVSGAAGDVSKGEPYDAGNMETSDQNKLEKKMSGDESTPARPNPETALDEKQDTNSSDTTTSDTTSSVAAGSGPGSGGKSSTGADEGEPDTKVMGEGPKPLETVAKEHGGDAGNNTNKYKGDANKPAAGADGAVLDKSDKKESEGTGEQYVKTTGFAADGGDFDATKPGAGREADRLLEQKGVHHEGGPDKVSHKDPHKDSHKDTHKDNSSSHSGSKDKPSLGERIKNKLHRH